MDEEKNNEKIIENEINLIVGKNLRHQRKKLKLSTAEVAFRANISRAYLGRIERGEVTASHHIILKITIALDLDMNNAFKGTHPKIKRYLKQFKPDE